MHRKKLLLPLLLLFSLPAGAQSAMGNWVNTGPLDFPVPFTKAPNGVGRVSQIKFHPTDSLKMYAVSSNGGLFLSNNKGVTWSACPGTDKLPQTSCGAVCVNPLNDRTIYLGLGDAYLSNSQGKGAWKSTDGGASWSAANVGFAYWSPFEILMDPTDTNTLVAAIVGGIFKTTNGGLSWNLIVADRFTDLKAFPKPGSRKLYAVTGGNLGYLNVSSDFGSTWTRMSSFFNSANGNFGRRIAVSPADTSRVYVGETADANFNGDIYKSTDEGATFSLVSTNTDCIVCYSPSFNSCQGDYNFDINANPRNADELLLVSHAIWHSKDAGVTWTECAPYGTCHTDFHQIEWNPYNNSELWNANDGGIYRSTDTNAAIWNASSAGLANTEMYHAAQSPTIRDLVNAGTQDNGEFLYDNGRWKNLLGGDDNTTRYIDYGAVKYDAIFGNRKKLVPLGGITDYHRPYPYSFFSNTYKRMAFLRNGVAYIIKDSVWRTNNINAAIPAWQMIKATTAPVRDLAVCAADSNIVYVVSSPNILFRSDNALAASPSWTTLTTPASVSVIASLATSRRDANIVFLSCGTTIYRSTDKGVTWQNITGTGLSGLNIRQIIHDDYSYKQRLFVNAGPYVHYKDSTTTAWTNHTTAAGLPTVANATDMMIYNDSTASAVLRVATYGRGLWECNINNNLPPVPDFSADNRYVCVGDTVHFTQNVHGAAPAFSWSFSGASPASATAPDPAVAYTTPGTYTVTLTATNAGGTGSITKSAYITVISPQLPPLAEGFEGSAFPPTGWQLQRLSDTAWAGTSTASGYGSSTRSAVWDNFSFDAGGEHDRLITPELTLPARTNYRLTFDLAHALRDTLASDTMEVRISTDCGKHWSVVYNKGGSGLATTTSFYSSAIFIPTASQWRTDTVSLLSYAGQSVLISFENAGHLGQAVYLDNINLTLFPLAAFGVSDSTICAGDTVRFLDSSANATSWAWSFAGGTPSASSAQNPTVIYASPGIYNVSLQARSASGSHTISRNGFVHVAALPAPAITASGTTLSTSGAAGSAYQWYLNGLLVTGATARQYTPAQNGTYTVRETNAAGCTGLSAAYNYTELGIDGALRGISCNLYPNPSDGAFILDVGGVSASMISITCYNSVGVAVIQTNIACQNGAANATLDWSSLPRGIYTVSVKASDMLPYRQKIVLQ